ncbi:MAG: hypothetical protein LC121_26700 [Anaerolineae bacterium]|nr:hypothetical protein [Anaerolineae bacterium]
METPIQRAGRSGDRTAPLHPHILRRDDGNDAAGEQAIAEAERLLD